MSVPADEFNCSGCIQLRKTLKFTELHIFTVISSTISQEKLDIKPVGYIHINVIIRHYDQYMIVNIGLNTINADQVITNTLDKIDVLNDIEEKK